MSRIVTGPGIVSILTLDRLDLTKKAVNSVLEYSTGDVRFVFFDNGSTDGTLDYLVQLKENQPEGRVTVLGSKENIGVAPARNRIFKNVISRYGNGFDWVLNLDNDCVVHPGYDAALSRCIKETDALAVCPRIIQPDGRMFHDAHNGFLINLNRMELKLEYGDSVSLRHDDPRVAQRMETDVILGTSAKTPTFFDNVGVYDEGHKIGWEDYSIALRALGLGGQSFSKWRAENKHGGRDWVPLRELMNGNSAPRSRVMYEPACTITHDHPVSEGTQPYERVRWHTPTIAESTKHFKDIWGVKPLIS